MGKFIIIKFGLIISNILDIIKYIILLYKKGDTYWTHVNFKRLELVLKNHLHKNFLTMQDVTIKTTNKQATTSTVITQSLIYGT